MVEGTWLLTKQGSEYTPVMWYIYGEVGRSTCRDVTRRGYETIENSVGEGPVWRREKRTGLRGDIRLRRGPTGTGRIRRCGRYLTGSTCTRRRRTSPRPTGTNRSRDGGCICI